MLEIGRAGTFSILYHQHAQWVGQTVFSPMLNTDTPEDILPLLGTLWQRGDYLFTGNASRADYRLTRLFV